MNLKKLVSGLLLSTALAAGVGVSVASQKSGVKEVSAATATTVYYAVPSATVGSYTVKLNINRQGDASNWATYTMSRDGTKTQGGKLLYKATYTDLYDGVGAMQFQLYDGDTWKSQQQPISSWTAVGTYNGKVYVHDTGWAAYNPDTVTYTVTKYKVLDGASPVSIGSDTVAAGTNYPVPANRYEAGYTFDGWYTTSACTTKYTAKAINSNTGIYAKYTSHAAWTGTIHVDLRDTWSDAAANYAVYFMDKTTYPSEIGGWSTYTMGTAANVKLVNISYSLPFEPKEMTLVRYNSTYSQANWNSQKWPTDGNRWGQTPDLSVNEVVRVGTTVEDGKNLAYLGYPKVVLWNPSASDVSLGTVKLNGSNHAEYYSTSVTLAANQQFKVQIAPYADGDYYGNYSTHSSLTSDFSGGGSSNIVCKTAGTYAFYFDSTNNSTYITKVELAEADEWSQYFLNNVGCDPTGRNVPSGWSSCATEYAKLSGAAKNIVYGATANPSGSYIEQAVARYDQALRSHPSLSHFIVNSGDTPRSAAINILPTLSIQQSGTTIVIIAISATSLAAVGGYFLFRKKKEN